MTNSDILSYVGIIAGGIGAITGIAGSVMGFLSYRKTSEIKSLELRLEVVKSSVDVFQKLEELSALLTRARNSRDAVAAATGMYKSGAHERWLRQLQADEESLESLQADFDEQNDDHSQSTLPKLEKALGEIHGLRAILGSILDRYLNSMREDDQAREFLRDQAHSRSRPL